MKQVDRLKIYENFFHKINVYCITMNTDKIREAVGLIDNWSYAHRCGNGEYSSVEQRRAIDHIIKKMQEF